MEAQLVLDSEHEFGPNFELQFESAFEFGFELELEFGFDFELMFEFEFEFFLIILYVVPPSGVHISSWGIRVRVVSTHFISFSYPSASTSRLGTDLVWPKHFLTPA